MSLPGACSLFIFLTYWSDHRRKFNGQIICLYGILYSAERFLVEGLRTDSLMIGPLRQAQVISLAIIAVCAAIYFILKKQNKSLRYKEIFNEIRYSRSA